jgi:hypothetical protein
MKKLKLFPTLVIDDFLDNPDKVRQMALAMDYEPTNGNYPGYRTKNLYEINPKLFNYMSQKFFSAFFDFNIPIKWNITVCFQKIYAFSNDKDAPVNDGWIHTDDDRNVLSGVLYLNPDPAPYTGTNICQPKSDDFSYNKLDSSYNDTKISLYRDNNKLENYNEKIKEFNDMFTDTIQVSNLYNRLIAFDAQSFHNANSYHFIGDEPRLTCVFFVDNIITPSMPPLERIRSLTMESHNL